MNAANDNFVLKHREDDVRKLALGSVPEGVDLRWCLQQIEGWQLARKKLPRWAETEGLWFPPRLSMEQCSSQQTAEYKVAYPIAMLKTHSDVYGKTDGNANSDKDDHTVCPGTFVDLTGGFGVDFCYMAPRFQHAVYVERSEELCAIARHNFPLLGLSEAKVCCATAEAWLDKAETVFANADDRSIDSLEISDEMGDFSGLCRPLTLFLDPARRDDAGRKVVALDDCSPNLQALHDRLLSVADSVVVKLSPMLDISQVLRQLPSVADVHVVSVQGECKELLLVLSRVPQRKMNTLCVNLGTPEDHLLYTRDKVILPSTTFEAKVQYVEEADKASLVGRLLFEPNASVLKAGFQDASCGYWGLLKLHPNSHLFVSTNPADSYDAEAVSHWSGRVFRIDAVSDFSKQGLRSVLGGLEQANLTIRNFPSTVAELRKRLKLKEGGEAYLFATTLCGDEHVLLRTSKIGC